MHFFFGYDALHHTLYFILFLFEVFFCGLFWFPAVSTTALQCHSCDLAVTVSARARKKPVKKAAERL